MLIVDLSSSTSPRASTVILRERSPFATAVVTSAMLRTWLVRLAASVLTLSVRSFQTPRDAAHLRLAAELPVGADLARDARHLGGEGRQLVDHRVHRLADAEELALQRLALDRQRHLLREVAVGDRVDHARDLGRRADEVVDHRVDRVRGSGPTCRRGPGARRARSGGPRGRSSAETRTSSRVVRSRVSASSLNARASSPARPARRAFRRMPRLARGRGAKRVAELDQDAGVVAGSGPAPFALVRRRCPPRLRRARRPGAGTASRPCSHRPPTVLLFECMRARRPRAATLGRPRSCPRGRSAARRDSSAGARVPSTGVGQRPPEPCPRRTCPARAGPVGGWGLGMVPHRRARTVKSVCRFIPGCARAPARGRPRAPRRPRGRR